MARKNLNLSHLAAIIGVVHPSKRDALKDALNDGLVIIADDKTLEGKALLYQCEKYKVPCLGKSQVFELPGGVPNGKQRR